MLAVPPEYLLSQTYVKELAGSSPSVSFTVTSEPPLAADTKHTLMKYGEKNKHEIAPKRFKIDDGPDGLITFHDVRFDHSGHYNISCYNDDWQKGGADIELSIALMPHMYPLRPSTLLVSKTGKK